MANSGGAHVQNEPILRGTSVASGIYARAKRTHFVLNECNSSDLRSVQNEPICPPHHVVMLRYSPKHLADLARCFGVPQRDNQSPLSRAVQNEPISHNHRRKSFTRQSLALQLHWQSHRNPATI